MDLDVQCVYNFAMRPEEIIADVYRQISLKREQGNEPDAVLMNLKDYRLLEWYRNFIGEAGDSELDYLGQYELFGVEIFIEDIAAPLVR